MKRPFGTRILPVVLTAFAMTTLGLTRSASADTPQQDCANSIAVAVQAKANSDFPGEDLHVTPPNLQGWDFGNVTTMTVQAGNRHTPLYVNYLVTIDESCSIISGPTLQQ